MQYTPPVRPIGFEYGALCCECGARRTLRMGGPLNRRPRGYVEQSDVERMICTLKRGAGCGLTKHAIVQSGVPTARRPLDEDEEWAGLVELAATLNITIRILGESSNWRDGEAARLFRCLERDETELLISSRCTLLERIEIAHHVLLQLITTDDRDLRWEIISAPRSHNNRPYAQICLGLRTWETEEDANSSHMEGKHA